MTTKAKHRIVEAVTNLPGLAQDERTVIDLTDERSRALYEGGYLRDVASAPRGAEVVTADDLRAAAVDAPEESERAQAAAEAAESAKA
jgi:hypothetical protein